MKRSTEKGTILERGAAGFDAAVLGTSFNARDPGRRPDVVVQANNVPDVIDAVKRVLEYVASHRDALFAAPAGSVLRD